MAIKFVAYANLCLFISNPAFIFEGELARISWKDWLYRELACLPAQFEHDWAEVAV